MAHPRGVEPADLETINAIFRAAHTLKSMGRKQQKEIPDVIGSRGAKFDSDFYQNSDAERFVDDRWKKELTPRQLRIFNLIGGRLNARYGYAAASGQG